MFYLIIYCFNKIKCWPPGKVAYPDYMKKKTQDWWIESIERHHTTLEFDGLWIVIFFMHFFLTLTIYF